MEELCGFEVSSTDVSRATQLLDEQLDKWRTRSLSEHPIKYLVLDARYEKVRVDGAVISCAILIAVGIREDGKRMILGVSVSLSEAEIHWRNFLEALQNRGLHGVKYIVSDDHKGILAALKSRFTATPWQRCQFHLQRNASAYVPKVSMRKEVAYCIKDIFNSPSIEEAQSRLNTAIIKYQNTASSLASWMESALPQGFTVFQLPPHHQKRMRTSNLLENLNRQIKRRTRVAGLFPNESSVLRLISAILMETSEDWETGRTYLNFNSEEP